jgi:NADH-quinone oxidoreductase subunit M
MIAWAIYLTFAGAVFLLFLPRALARWVALATTAAGFAISVAAFFAKDTDFAHFTTLVRVPWVPALGMNYHLALDGISLTMTLVTGLTAVCAVLFSWKVEERPNEFFFWLLLVVAGSYGVFLSADLFLFFLFYELVIVPKYFLIAIWGSTNKEYGAMKLTLYLFGGALFSRDLPLHDGHRVLDSSSLRFHHCPAADPGLPVLFRFGVLAGIWPLHTWAPPSRAATAGLMPRRNCDEARRTEPPRVALNPSLGGLEQMDRWASRSSGSAPCPAPERPRSSLAIECEPWASSCSGWQAMSSAFPECR